VPVVDDRRFVERLIATVPEAFADAGDREFYLDDEPLSYPALGHARIWLEDNALRIRILPRRARVRPDHVDVFRRFWTFIEEEAQSGKGDDDLETLLQIECFEGVGWVEDVLEYLGPATRALLDDAQRSLSRYNGQIGRWAKRRDRRT
jgi:hypothetical protein